MTFEQQVSKLKDALVAAHLREAARNAGLPAPVIDDLANYAQQFEVAPDLQTVRHAESGVAPGDWLTSMRESRPHWFGSSKAGGGESFADSENPWTAANWNITKQGKIMESSMPQAEAMAKAAGVDVMAAHPKDHKK